MRFQFPLFLPAIAAALCLPMVLEAQSKRTNDLAVGRLLVAPRECPDPSFAKTVILLVNLDRDGAMGLIINHRTSVPISHALEKLSAASHRSDPMFVGGPVDLSSVFGLLRVSSKPDEARRVLGDVYLITSRSLLEKTLAGSLGPDQFHAYAGYCGWGAGQLQSEMERGGWYIFGGDPSWVFDSDPESVWSRLIARTEQNIARLSFPGR
jgi:putative transcriptional regulator